MIGCFRARGIVTRAWRAASQLTVHVKGPCTADRAVAGGSVDVGGGLQGEELGVAARKAHELGVGALLGRPSVLSLNV
jgi:hypothetical protein